MRALFARAAAARERADDTASIIDRDIAADLEGLAEAMLADRISLLEWDDEAIAEAEHEVRRDAEVLRRMTASAERRRRLADARDRLFGARVDAERASLEARAAAADVRGEADEAEALRRRARDEQGE